MGGAQAVLCALEAQRALRMAKVLASGGFPEEAPALLAKVLQKAAAGIKQPNAA